MGWHQLQQPKKLEKLATVKIAKWITLHVEKILKPISNLQKSDAANDVEDSYFQQIQIIPNYYIYAPDILKHKILNVIMEKLSDMLEKLFLFRDEDLTESFHQHLRHVTDQIIAMLLPKNLTNLSINYVEMQTFGASFCSKSYMLTDLTDLKLEISLEYSEENEDGEIEYQYEDNMEANIKQLLKGLHSLKYLSVSSTDNVLRCIAENCKLIEKLDLYYYFNVSTNSIDLILTQLPNLDNVNLYESKVAVNDEVEYQVENRKRRILEHIASRKEFDVKSYVSYCETTSTHLQIDFKRYPLIQTLNFAPNHRFQTLHIYLEALSNLKDLHNLTIHEQDFYTGHVKEVLQLVGSKVQKLEFVGVDNIDLNALKYISLKCPHLQELDLYRCNLIKETVVPNMYPCYMEIPSFRNLQKFSWIPGEKNEQSLLRFLLSNFPNVEFMDIMGNLAEDIMLDVLDKNPLSRLKELLMNSKLTKPVMDQIIGSGVSPEVIVSGTKEPLSM